VLFLGKTVKRNLHLDCACASCGEVALVVCQFSFRSIVVFESSEFRSYFSLLCRLCPTFAVLPCVAVSAIFAVI